MSAGATTCETCGAKFRATHKRCPRCRAVLAPAAAAAPARKSGIDPMTIAIVLLVCAIPAVFWWSRGTEEAPVPSAAARPTAQPAPAVAPGPPPAVVEDPARLPAPPPTRLSPRLPADPEGADPARALTEHRAALEREPNNAAALLGVGRSLLALGRIQEALPPLRQAVQSRPGDWASAFIYGFALAAANDSPGAGAAFRNARSLAPDDPISIANLAVALLRIGDRAAAAEAFAAAVALDPADAPAQLGLAVSLDAAGQATEAAAAYGDYLRLTSPGPEADRITARLTFLAQGRGSS